MSAMRLDDSHDRPMELAALALDFDLTAAERNELEAHLATCPTCARRVAAMRADARTLSRPLTLLPSSRVDAAVYAAIAGRQPRPQRLLLLAAAALLLLAILGAVAVGAALLQRFERLPTAVTPTQPVAVVSPDPDASPAVLGDSWEAIPFETASSGGLVEAVTFNGTDLVGVGQGGCVVDSEGAGECHAAAWTAPAGGAWTRAPDQPGLAVGLGVVESAPQKGIYDVASGPAGLVAIGYDIDPLRSSCAVAPCTSGPGVWRSTDGRTWERVQVDFGPAVIDTFSEPIAAIAAGPDGYVMVGHAIALSPTGATEAHATAWASPDGVTWTRAADSEDLDVGPCVDTGEDPSCGGMLGVSATATGFVAVGEALTSMAPRQTQPAAWTSPDGLRWTRADVGLDFFANSVNIGGSLSGIAIGGPGLVAVGTMCSPDCRGSRASGLGATSIDGSTWRLTRIGQAPALSHVTSAGGPLFALGVTDPGAGPPTYLELWRSDDGLWWQFDSGFPSMPDLKAYGGADLAVAPDRVVVGGWAEVTGADTFRNFSYSRSPGVLPTLGESVPARVGQFGDVVNHDPPQLVSETAGWQSTGHGFYRTEDMGETWTQVRPPGWSATAAGLVTAVDAETMYAALPGPPVTIAATHDGGVSWAQATIDDPSIVGGPLFSFRTADQGTATFSGGETELRVYETTDGGRTWAGPVVVTAPSNSTGGGIEGPVGGVMWISNGKADNKPFDNTLHLSMDGGVTWKERSLPIGDAAPKDELKSHEAMWADESGLIVMAISLGEGPQIYRSTSLRAT